MNQRYVSKELTHFVGGNIRNQRGEFDSDCADRQFDLLVHIVTTGCLRSPERKCDDALTLNSPNSGVIDYRDVVCFCDIPVDDLQIHMGKYSEFGIAFKKEFLISKGANPVLYIVQQTGALASAFDRFLFFDVVTQRVAFRLQVDTSIPPELAHDLVTILVFCKNFPPMRPDEDPENYYMEREWRLVGNLYFQQSNICRVILPERYARRFRDECPDYFGQITFSD